jgi:hypothetical protein
MGTRAIALTMSALAVLLPIQNVSHRTDENVVRA